MLPPLFLPSKVLLHMNSRRVFLQQDTKLLDSAWVGTATSLRDRMRFPNGASQASLYPGII